MSGATMTMRQAMRGRYDAGESLASLAQEYSMPVEDVFALICLARDEAKRPWQPPPPRDEWRIRVSSHT